MISMIWAQDRQGLIGLDNNLPWHRPLDLKNFSRLTKGNTVVMGRKTYEGIGQSLKDRENIVFSRTKYGYIDGIYHTDYLYDVTLREDNIFIIGGMQVYKSFAPFVERLYVTVIDEIFLLRGESVFFPWPAFADSQWQCQEQRMLGPDFHYVFNKVDKYASKKKENCQYTTT